MSVIERDDKIIGTYQDLYTYLSKTASDLIAEDEWEEVQEVVQVVLKLWEYANHDGLLVIDDHNGMGKTIEKYEGE